MAIWTAAAGGGNWNNPATWVEGGGYPVAGDTALLVATSGAVTVNVNSACATLDLTGYKSTLALGVNALTVSGNVTIGTTAGSVATLSIGISAGTGLTIGGNLLVGARGTITCSGASKVYCAGSWDVSAGTFVRSTSTVTFNATSSGKTVKSGSNTYYNVTWNGSGGEWTLQDNLTHSAGGTATLTLGTLVLSGKTYTCAKSYTLTLGSGFTLAMGTGRLTGGSYGLDLNVSTGAVVTISTGSLYIAGAFTVAGTGEFNCTGAAVLEVRGNISISSAGWSAGTSTIYSGYNNHVNGTLSSTQPLYNYQVGYNNSDIRDAAVTLNSDLTVLNNFTIQYSAGYTRSFSAGSHTLTVGGNFDNQDTFNAGTGTVIFNDATKTTTVSGNTTFNVLRIETPGKVVKFTAGTTQTVASFVATGAAGQNVVLTNVTGTGTWALSDASGTNQVHYCTISYSAAAGGASWLAYTTDGNVDAGGNSGWVFTPTGANSMLLMFD
jgi:hypothetical protein